MTTLQTDIIIAAPTDVVWQVLIDFNNYHKWNPFIKAISGKAAVGSELSVAIQPPESNRMTFKPRIVALKPEAELRWKGKLLFPGLFDGDHHFTLERISDDRTRFSHGENFSGILAGLLIRFIGESTQTGFIQMNEALKKQSEDIYKGATNANRIVA